MISPYVIHDLHNATTVDQRGSASQMRPLIRLRAILYLVSILSGVTTALAQQRVPRIAFKSGESIQLMNVFDIVNCRSVAITAPEVEVLEGPPELTVTIKEQPIVPRAYNCANPVPGGKLVVTAGEIDRPKEAKLTFRVKSKARNGDHQWAYVYDVSLFPAAPPAENSAPATPKTESAEPASPH